MSDCLLSPKRIASRTIESPNKRVTLDVNSDTEQRSFSKSADFGEPVLVPVPFAVRYLMLAELPGSDISRLEVQESESSLFIQMRLRGAEHGNSLACTYQVSYSRLENPPYWTLSSAAHHRAYLTVTAL
jgi:hypothetical protein